MGPLPDAGPRPSGGARDGRDAARQGAGAHARAAGGRVEPGARPSAGSPSRHERDDRDRPMPAAGAQARKQLVVESTKKRVGDDDPTMLMVRERRGEDQAGRDRHGRRRRAAPSPRSRRRRAEDRGHDRGPRGRHHEVTAGTPQANLKGKRDASSAPRTAGADRDRRCCCSRSRRPAGCTSAASSGLTEQRGDVLGAAAAQREARAAVAVVVDDAARRARAGPRGDTGAGRCARVRTSPIGRPRARRVREDPLRISAIDSARGARRPRQRAATEHELVAARDDVEDLVGSRSSVIARRRSALPTRRSRSGRAADTIASSPTSSRAPSPVQLITRSPGSAARSIDGAALDDRGAQRGARATAGTARARHAVRGTSTPAARRRPVRARVTSIVGAPTTGGRCRFGRDLVAGQDVDRRRRDLRRAARARRGWRRPTRRPWRAARPGRETTPRPRPPRSCAAPVATATIRTSWPCSSRASAVVRPITPAPTTVMCTSKHSTVAQCRSLAIVAADGDRVVRRDRRRDRRRRRADHAARAARSRGCRRTSRSAPTRGRACAARARR